MTSGEGEGFVKINNSFMANESYSHREQFIYLVLKSMANSINGSTVVDIQQLASLHGLSSHSKNRKAMQSILISLVDKKLLLLYTDVMLSNPVEASEMKLTNVYYGRVLDTGDPTRGFTKIYYSDVLKFLSIEEKSKDLLFAIYFNIIHRIYDSDKSSNYSWVTIEKIKSETGIDRKTIMDKIAIMKENEILYFEKVSESAIKDKNYYCRWIDRSKLIDALRPDGEVE